MNTDDASTMWAHDEYQFHGQRQGEHVMLVRRQHPIIFLPIVVWAVVSLILPYLFVRFTGGSFRVYSVAVYLVMVAYYLFHHFYAFRNSLSILTNQRILQTKQRGFFSNQMSEAELNRIQDVSSDIKGILATLFGYGNVTIRTASKDSLLVLANIGDPYDVQQAIVRALKETGKAEE